jgi:hypothetical protein
MFERRLRWEKRVKKHPYLAKPLARLCPDHKLMDGVNAGRVTLPLVRFDAERCAKGLECLREYKAEWDQIARVFKKTPNHNWASHGADAWRTLSVSWREPVPEEVTAPLRGMHEMTIDELWNAQPRRIAEARI